MLLFIFLPEVYIFLAFMLFAWYIKAVMYQAFLPDAGARSIWGAPFLFLPFLLIFEDV